MVMYITSVILALFYVMMYTLVLYGACLIHPGLMYMCIGMFFIGGIKLTTR
jgi:hypothetical protein